MGEIVLLEVLQGRVMISTHPGSSALSGSSGVTMLGDTVAVAAAHNDRLPRERGITLRKTAHLIYWHVLHREWSCAVASGW